MARKTAEAEVQPIKAPDSPSGPNMGSFHERLPKPEWVGDITAGEALEIRARNDLIKKLDEDARQAMRILNIAQNEKMGFIDRLIEQYGYDRKNQYSIDDSSGAISLIAKFIPAPEAAPATPEEPAIE